MKPHIAGKENEIENEVTKLEESILFFSDAYRLYGPGSHIHHGENIPGNSSLPESDIHDVIKDKEFLEDWQLEAAKVDRAIQILPGVKRIIDSIPDGRYAVATSGTKIFGNSIFLIFS